MQPNIRDIDGFYGWLWAQGRNTEDILFNTFSEARLTFLKTNNVKDFLLQCKLFRKHWFNKHKHTPIMLSSSLFDFAQDILLHEQEYRWLYSKLVDEDSRQTLLCILLYKVTLDRAFLTDCTRHTADQYFDPDIMRFSDNEIIADCGAYTGDSALLYYRLFKKCRKYYLFEPDTANMQFAQRTLVGLENIAFCQCATGSASKTNGFSPNAAGGNVNSGGDILVSVKTLDEAVHEKLTFIKMDIEGSEVETLEGAKEQIQQNRPRLAVCVYHKPDDAWRVARKILDLRSDYELHLRLYFSTYCEAVVYAV